MSYDTKSIEREIAQARGALGQQLTEAEDKMREVVDWRTHYRRNPLPFLAGAAAVGVAINALLGGSDRGPRRAMMSDSAGIGAGIASTHLTSQAGHAFEHLADVLIAVGTAKVAKYVDAYLPGFHEEFTRRR